MIRLTAPQTYRVIYYALTHPIFTQTEIHEQTGVSIGRVNQVNQWLIKRRYAEKADNGYRITAPISLLNLMTAFRSMDEPQILKRDVDVPREQLLEHLVEEDSVFCLTSALQHYDAYFRDPSLSVYVRNGIKEEIEKLPRGTTRVELYQPDLPMENNIQKKDSIELTTEVRTVIDLFCANKAYVADRLIRRIW